MPKINHQEIRENVGTGYPAPYNQPCITKRSRDIGAAGSLTQFGARTYTLPPGAWSSQRHWHSYEDELVYIISGNPTFIDDEGEQILSPGDFTAHPGGDGNGHHMINKSDENVTFLVIGTRAPEKDHCYYPDIDMELPMTGEAGRVWVRKDGSAF